MDTKPIRELIEAAKSANWTDAGEAHEEHCRLYEAIPAAECALAEVDEALRIADALSEHTLNYPGKSENGRLAYAYRCARGLERRESGG